MYTHLEGSANSALLHTHAHTHTKTYCIHTEICHPVVFFDPLIFFFFFFLLSCFLIDVMLIRGEESICIMYTEFWGFFFSFFL